MDLKFSSYKLVNWIEISMYNLNMCLLGGRNSISKMAEQETLDPTSLHGYTDSTIRESVLFVRY